jgi:hypothetical protein
MKEKKISLHLNSNKPNNFSDLIESVSNTISDISILEIIVHIDDGDYDMVNMINKINNKYPYLVKFIQTNLINSFSDAWKPLNYLLKQTSKSVLIISCISDDIRFLTKNWDRILLSYDNFFGDKIYRLRCSKFKYQEYNDIWQCGYAPDSYAFYSKKWLYTVNEWCPCIGPDSYHECISFYMNKISNDYNRNIIVKEIDFSGETVSTGLSLKSRLNRTRIYYKAFFILMSYKTQVEALNRAELLIKKIDTKRTKDLNNLEINYLSHKITNLKRRFNFFVHRGTRDHSIRGPISNIIFMIWCYIKFFDNFIIKAIKLLYKKNYLKKVVKNKKTYDNLKEILDNEK